MSLYGYGSSNDQIEGLNGSGSRLAFGRYMSHVTTSNMSQPRSEIPVDVLRDILDHVDQAGLATMCRVNKICCSCSQDVLYRDISVKTIRAFKVQQTLAQSAHLAKRVHSFDSSYNNPDLAMALRNMTSLRILKLSGVFHVNILDGCTFKLDSFEYAYLTHHDESLPIFLSSQPSLKYVTLPNYAVSPPLDATCLPNLTRINVTFPWLRDLIPGRPLNEVIIVGGTSNKRSIDWSFFALSTTPIQKLTIDYSFLYSTPIHLLAPFLPSLTHFTLKILNHYIFFKDEGVCELPLY